MRVLRPSTILFLLSAANLLQGASILEEVEVIEAEQATEEGFNNVKDTEGVRKYLDEFYHENCQTFKGEKYEEYMVPNVTVNMQGGKFQGFGELHQLLDNLECHVQNYKVWEIERHGDHAIASVKSDGEVENAPDLAVVIHELVRDASTGKWHTEIMLDFTDVNFSADGDTNRTDDEKEIEQFIEDLFERIRAGNGMAGHESDFPDDLSLNMGGRKIQYLMGSAGHDQISTHLKQYDIKDFKVIDVEAKGDTAIAMVTGHINMDNHYLAFLQAMEMRKNEEGGWIMDVIIVFVRHGQ